MTAAAFTLHRFLVALATVAAIQAPITVWRVRGYRRHRAQVAAAIAYSRRAWAERYPDEPYPGDELEHP